MLIIFSSPNNNFLTKNHLFHPERQTVENISIWARCWSQKSPKSDFRSFCAQKRKKRPKGVLDAKVHVSKKLFFGSVGVHSRQ